MNVEEDLEVLSYYVNPNYTSYRFNTEAVQRLKRVGYLRSGLTPEFRETLKTTGMGRVYLKSYGIAVPEDNRQRWEGGTRFQPDGIMRRFYRTDTDGMTEEEAIEILSYHLMPCSLHCGFSRHSIEILEDLGYLECDITSGMSVEAKTTRAGRRYLKSHGRLPEAGS